LILQALREVVISKIPCATAQAERSDGGESRNLVIQRSPKRSKSLILQALREVVILHKITGIHGDIFDNNIN